MGYFLKIGMATKQLLGLHNNPRKNFWKLVRDIRWRYVCALLNNQDRGAMICRRLCQKWRKQKGVSKIDTPFYRRRCTYTCILTYQNETLSQPFAISGENVQTCTEIESGQITIKQKTLHRLEEVAKHNLFTFLPEVAETLKFPKKIKGVCILPVA